MINQTEPWWIKPFILLIGITVSFIFNIFRERYLQTQKDKRIRRAILEEIKSNSEYGRDVSEFSYSTKIFNAHISYVGCFKEPDTVSNIVRYYSLIEQHNELLKEIKGINEMNQEDRSLSKKFCSVRDNINELGKKITNNTK